MTERASANETPRRRWVWPVLFVLIAGVVVLLGLLTTSILERRWEAQRPHIAVVPLDTWEIDPAAWGEAYPLQYETYRAQAQGEPTRTAFGGSFPRDYLAEDPKLVILWAGYGFMDDYRQARGHPNSLKDVRATARTGPKTVGTCMTCKSGHVPELISDLGAEAFYATPFQQLAAEMEHPIACIDCHDPKTLKLRVLRPALTAALAAQGRPIEEATHQEMRSLVCAQCHVEYYFRDGVYLVLPWGPAEAKGGIDAQLAYYNRIDFADYVHPISGTRIVKSQHPDYEIYRTGVHHYRGVACADCHMPYVTSGGVKFTSHHVRSPLLAVEKSCMVCHGWTREEIVARVEAIQTKVHEAEQVAEAALVRAHFDVAAARGAGADDAALAGPRSKIRDAQFLWDSANSQNGMGFHSPQETMRLLLTATDLAQEARVAAARVLAAQGVAAAPRYPDISTKAKATAVAEAFMDGQGPALLP